MSTNSGLQLLPVSLSNKMEAVQIVEVGGKEVHIHGPSDAEDILSFVFGENPKKIVVDYSVPAAVNEEKYSSSRTETWSEPEHVGNGIVKNPVPATAELSQAVIAVKYMNS